MKKDPPGGRVQEFRRSDGYGIDLDRLGSTWIGATLTGLTLAGRADEAVGRRDGSRSRWKEVVDGRGFGRATKAKDVE